MPVVRITSANQPPPVIAYGAPADAAVELLPDSSSPNGEAFPLGVSLPPPVDDAVGIWVSMLVAVLLVLELEGA
jgi:hypothetical protein